MASNLYLLALPFWVGMYQLMAAEMYHKKAWFIFQGLVITSIIFHGLVALNRLVSFPAHSVYSYRRLVVESLQDPYKLTTPRYARPPRD
jgi:hypothetical protein